MRCFAVSVSRLRYIGHTVALVPVAQQGVLDLSGLPLRPGLDPRSDQIIWFNIAIVRML